MFSTFLKLLFSGLLLTTCSLINNFVYAESDTQFQPLFIGQTLAGWHGYQQSEPPNNWSVKNGQIHADGNGPDLISQKSYSDFELRFE